MLDSRWGTRAHEKRAGSPSLAHGGSQLPLGTGRLAVGPNVAVALVSTSCLSVRRAPQPASPLGAQMRVLLEVTYRNGEAGVKFARGRLRRAYPLALTGRG